MLGEEGPGVPVGLPLQRLAIPMPGGIESLNATVAAGIARQPGRGQRPVLDETGEGHLGVHPVVGDRGDEAPGGEGLADERIEGALAALPRATVEESHAGRATRVGRAVRAGTLWVNTFLVRDLTAPFGGMGISGIGREGGDYALDFYSDLKTLQILDGTTA